MPHSTPAQPADSLVRPWMLVRAVPDDAGAIASLHGALFPDAWSAADVAALTEAPGGLGLVVAGAAGTPLAGFAIGRVAADEAEVLSIGVAPAQQRGGLGAALVTALGDAARSAGARRLFLEVSADNEPARALYRRLGFAEIGRRKGYYRHGSGPGIDALLLAREL